MDSTQNKELSRAEVVKQAGTFSEEEQLLLGNALHRKSFKKGAILLAKNSICNKVHFLITGAVCHSLHDSDGNVRIIDLNVPEDWILNVQSLTSQKPSQHTIA